MKISESWLREWVNPRLDTQAVCEAFTMAGLEIEGITPVAPDFKKVVVGEVLETKSHPEADKLTLCKVAIGKKVQLDIVCGASNVRAGLKVAVAVVGAELPDGMKIKPVKLRGEPSEGMLCSAVELGLAENSEGILELSADAPLGEDLRNYLGLDDKIIEVSITPNRGDCLSVRGLARELGAATTAKVTPINIIETVKKTRDTLSVTVKDTDGCPHYVGRVVRNVNLEAKTPVWMIERLRRSGIRSIHPVVDVTNYVMLELGQPMHAFDLDKIDQGIWVRLAKKGEEIVLLDGSKQTLDGRTLVIADKKNPLAIAGVMGGIDSSVTLLTKDIFLESAFFAPQTIARQRQYYNLNSDSAYRFERGVDPVIQRQAIERATALIQEIAGGEAGPITEARHVKSMPKNRDIKVTDENIKNVLGISIPAVDVKRILTSLGFDCRRQADKWVVLPPAWRFDMSLPEDVIEEIARQYGYDKIPMEPMSGVLQPAHIAKEESGYAHIRNTLSNLGFHEIISYSFINKDLHAELFDDKPLELLNPITVDMSVMRTSLWPGLLSTLLYNKSRQQHRVKLFEVGACFAGTMSKLKHIPRVAGLVAGENVPEQWGVKPQQVDFYDLKGSVDSLLASLSPGVAFSYRQAEHKSLHPGQTAEIYLDNRKVGIIGALHPLVAQALDVKDKAYLFELDLAEITDFAPPACREVTKFPEIRRDLAILLDQTIPSVVIQDTIRGVAGDWLNECFIFDVYQGKGISPGKKSIALAMVLQHPSRTLVDSEVVELTDRVVHELRDKLGAELRS